MKQIVLTLLMLAEFCSHRCYANPLLDSATQLIPQDPQHPVTVLNELKPSVLPEVKSISQSEPQPQIVTQNANGETQQTVMDQNGQWKILRKPSSTQSPNCQKNCKTCR